MNLKTRLFFLGLTFFIAFVVRKYINIAKSYPRPKIDEYQYWGPGNISNVDDYDEDTSVRPFQIRFTKEKVEELRNKLEDYDHIHPQLEGVNDEYGMNTNKLKEILKFWRDDYLPRWDQREEYLNGLPQFKTEIQGLNIHFIHAKPAGNTKGKKVLPLLLLHGWAGSLREFYEFIPRLIEIRNDQNFVFEVIAPSLPGFGWSDAAKKPGLGATNMAIVLRNLMKRLDFERYYVQGGDWGSIIGSNIATLYPNEVIAYHSNMCFFNTPMSILKHVIANFYPSYFVKKEYQSLYFPLADKFKFLLTETGYLHMAVTKPDTIGTVIEGNPIGLASYLLEKFNTFSQFLSTDELLDNFMVYYMTNSFTTSTRIYYETFSGDELAYNMSRVKTAVPTGCVRFPGDIFFAFDWQLKDKYTNLIHSTYMDIGGHFAAWEVPDVLYKDFKEFIKKTL